MDTAPVALKASPAAGSVMSVSDSAMGKDLYDKACTSCHDAGVAGAAKLSDKADWVQRIAQGKDTLYKHTTDGGTGSKVTHPPRGGKSTLSDEEVEASVHYMVNQAM